MQPEPLLLGREQEEVEQAPDLRRGQRNQVVGAPPFPAAALAAARLTSRKAWASKKRDIWRYHSVHDRTL